MLGFLLLLMAVRFIFTLLGANESHFFVASFINLTQGFVYPFLGLPNWTIGPLVINVPVLSAMISYLVGGLILIDLITGFIDRDPINWVVNVIDTIFKIFEFLLASRIILKVFGVNPTIVPFATDIYNYTNWAAGIFPAISLLWGVIEVSVIVVFIVIVIFDISLESSVEAARKKSA